MLKLLSLAALLAAAAATALAPGDYPKIKDLQSTTSTLHSVTLTWTLDVSQYTPVIYTLIVDNLLTVQFFHDGTFTYTETGLNPCHHYMFDLTASYDGGDVGETTRGYGSTLYEQPGVVGDVTVDGSTVSWTPPANTVCVEYYKVCSVSAVTGVTDCMEGLLDTTYDLGALSACDELDVSVFAVGGNLTSEPTTVHVSTEDGVPGQPRDLEVVALSETSVMLAWNPPLENPACVHDYAIVFGHRNDTEIRVNQDEDESKTQDDEDEEGERVEEGPHGQTETAILDNLDPCTDYRFSVAAVSESNYYSPESVVFLSTNGTAPGMLPDITYDTSEESITISWGDVSEETCLDVILICYVDPTEHEWSCVEVPSSPNTWTLEGLGACREYDIRITGLSPEGYEGEPVIIHVPTKDIAPGPVQNLELSHVGKTSVTLTYDAPLEYIDCADEYIVTYQNILDVVDEKSFHMRAKSFTTDIDGLDACALYDFGVSAVSPTGIEGPVEHVRTVLEQETPNPPSDGSVVTSTETTLTVLWFAPTDTRFCVDTYEARVSDDGSGGTPESIPVLEFNQQIMHTFTGLNPCTSYTVQIRSKNSELNSMSAYQTIVSDAMTLC